MCSEYDSQSAAELRYERAKREQDRMPLYEAWLALCVKVEVNEALVNDGHAPQYGWVP